MHLDDQFLVYYSMSFGDPARLTSLVRQLDTSLTTLRATNGDRAVAILCHGSVPDVAAAVGRRHGARIVELPDPVTRLRGELGEIGSVVGRFAPVHKFLGLETLAEISATTTLYLDADTIVFGDLAGLVPVDDRPRFTAREEVGSRRCPFGPDLGYLDEDALAVAVAEVDGPVPAPAFNTGVMLFHRFGWEHARAIERRYLAWLVRFAVWMADHPASPTAPQYSDVFDVAVLRRLLVGPEAERVRRLGVRYPSVNRWLAEEVAAWVALGHERDAHGVAISRFSPEDVAQGGEPLEGPFPHHVWHYFNSNQQGMERRLGLRHR